MNLVVLLLIIFMSNACAGQVTVAETYYYISLENIIDATITKWGESDLETLKSDSTMPIKYRLDREKYHLNFDVNVKSYLPSIFVQALSNSGTRLEIVPRPYRKARAGRAAPCGSFYPNDVSPNTIGFGWVTCDQVEAVNEQYISFDVVNESQQVVGEEDLPFLLRENGVYTYLDAL